MKEFEVLVQGKFSNDAIRVLYRPGVHIHWEPSVEEFIGDAWQTYVRSCRDIGITLYNGNVFRLDSFDRTGGRLSLMLSDIDFRSCIGTGTNRFVNAFPQAPQANPLTVAVALVAADGRIVLEKRSRIDARRRKYHVIAGYMEREFDAVNATPDPFATLAREVREELGLLLDGPVFSTGLVRTVYGSELCFYCRLSISFEQLVEVMARGETDREIDALEPLDDSPAAVASFLECHTADFVPAGRACLLLYGREAYGESWYDRVL